MNKKVKALGMAAEDPLFEVRRKGDEKGLHKFIAWLAPVFLMLGYFSWKKAKRKWDRFYTFLPGWTTMYLYTPNHVGRRLHQSVVVHENQHMRDAGAISVPVFALIYTVVNPVAIGLAFVSPWFLFLTPFLNPFRGLLEWRAYKREWEYRSLVNSPDSVHDWAKGLVSTFAGPSYLFMAPWHAIQVLLKLKGADSGREEGNGSG